MANIILSWAFVLVTLSGALAIASPDHRARVDTDDRVGVVKVVDRSGLKAHDPFDIIQAEDFDYAESVEVVPATDDLEDNSTNPQEVAFIYQYSKLIYYDVNFDQGANRMDMRIEQLSNSLTGDWYIGQVNFLFNSSTGDGSLQPFASVTADNGANAKYLTLSQFLNPVPTGTGDLHITFDDHYPFVAMLNLNWFKFYDVYG